MKEREHYNKLLTKLYKMNPLSIRKKLPITKHHIVVKLNFKILAMIQTNIIS